MTTVLSVFQRAERRRLEQHLLNHLPMGEFVAETRDQIAGRLGWKPERTQRILHRLVGQGKVKRSRTVDPENPRARRRMRYWMATGSSRTTSYNTQGAQV